MAGRARSEDTSLNDQPEYILGGALQRLLLEQQGALLDTHDTSVCVPEISDDSLRRTASSLKRMVVSQESSLPVPAGGEKRMSQKITGPGWKRQITLGPISTSEPDLGGMTRPQQTLTSVLTTGGDTHTVTVGYEDREGEPLATSTVEYFLRRQSVVEASTTMPVNKKLPTRRETVINVLAHLENYPSPESVSPRQTELVVTKPTLLDQTLPTNSVRSFAFDSSGRIIR